MAKNRGIYSPNTIKTNNRRRRNARSQIRGARWSFRELYILNNLREIDIGVTEFVTQAEGFNATMKSRFSDFHVNEIDLDGNLIKLTDRAVPYDLKIEDKANAELEAKLTKENGVPSEQMEEIKKMYATGDLQSKVEIKATKLSKEQQEAIPKIINEMFKGAVITKTETKGDDHIIKCIKMNKAVDDKWLWPEEYTYFVLHKLNISTSKALTMMLPHLGCNRGQILCASKTDRRAKTTQLCCIRKRDPDAILNAAKRIPMLQVGNFHFKSEPLNVGHPKGNRFRIALRNITVNDDVVKEALSNLESKGFINYYGLLRFGELAKVRTYDIGKAVIKADWKLACEIIMKPREHDHGNIKNIRTHWWENRDHVAALEMFEHRNRQTEVKILQGLVLFGKSDYFTAFHCINRSTRLLYAHAYQSLIWNKVVSRRIKEWGLVLREGDLVFIDRNKMNLNRYGNNTVLDDIDLSDLYEGEDPEEDKDDDGDDIKEESNGGTIAKEMPKYKTLAKPLTKRDISSGKYTIHDLVLPLPGYDILYPNNDTKKWYVEFLAEDGLTFDSFKHEVKDYLLPGEYRPVITKPTAFKWSLVEYKSRIEVLILSDLEELSGETLETLNVPEPPKSDEAKPVNTKSTNVNPEEKVGTAGDESQGGKAIILEFDLPSACYPNMVLREILKVDTSVGNQMKLNMEADGTKRKLSETGDEKTKAEEAKKIKPE